MSAGIYIHVPFCAVKCPYCDFYSAPFRSSEVQRYADAVCRNLNALPKQLQADTLYFGGGTPSLLPVDILCRITALLQERGLLCAGAEITLEANPLTVTPKNLTGWRKAGINRLSLGVQSFQADILRLLGRKHTPEQAKAAILRAADAGFENLSADLMIGTALHTPEILTEELQKMCALPLQHLSVYILKIEENTPFSECPPALSEDDDIADASLMIDRFLTENGFLHYEISNYALPGFESRHNCKYWRCEPYYGIGAAAHSCHDGKRFAVPRDLAGFCEAPLQPEEITVEKACGADERLMLGLRLKEGILLSDFPDSERILRAAAPLIPRWLRREGDRLRMTPEGWLVSNAVLAKIL